MSFADDLSKFSAKVERMTQQLLPAVAAHAMESIQVGDVLTGAPGQPVDTGNLRASWQVAFPSLGVAEITTNTAYAPANEYGVREDGRPYTQKSPVGGRHSVALTIAGMQRIVDYEALRLGQ